MKTGLKGARWRRWLVVTSGLIAFAAFSGWWFQDDISGAMEEVASAHYTDAFSRKAFDRWQVENAADQAEFDAFSAYLERQGVGDVVPVWQLMRTDAAPKPWCKRPAFLVPPRADWPHVVPALRLIRQHVIPVTGPVEVQSAYRTAAFNTCVGGASKSQHLRFGGIDLVTVREMDNRQLFKLLCDARRRAGPESHWGLGAYFDPLRPAANRDARFHVDAAGYRSWGFSKRAASSGCSLLSIVDESTRNAR